MNKSRYISFFTITCVHNASVKTYPPAIANVAPAHFTHPHRSLLPKETLLAVIPLLVSLPNKTHTHAHSIRAPKLKLTLTSLNISYTHAGHSCQRRRCWLCSPCWSPCSAQSIMWCTPTRPSPLKSCSLSR